MVEICGQEAMKMEKALHFHLAYFWDIRCCDEYDAYGKEGYRLSFANLIIL